MPAVSLADQKPPRHRYAERPLGWVEEGPLHPCLVTDVGTVILWAEPGGHTTGAVPARAGGLGCTPLGPTPGVSRGVGPVTFTPRRPYAIRSCGFGDISTEFLKSRVDTEPWRGAVTLLENTAPHSGW